MILPHLLAVLLMAAPSPAPLRPVDLPRPNLLWSHTGDDLVPEGGPVVDERGRLFLFDTATRSPYAVEVRTGKRLWSSEAGPPRIDTGTIHLSLTGDVLVLSAYDWLAAFRASDGARLWSFRQPKDCLLMTSPRGGHLRLDCDRQPRYRVFEAATGKRVALPGPVGPDDDVVLGERALMVFSEKRGRIQGRPFGPGPTWNLIFPGSSHARAGTECGAGFADGVMLCLGRTLVAIEELSGQRLWERPQPERSRTTAAGGLFWLASDEGMVALEARSGRVRERLPRPALLERGFPYGLTVAGDRITFVESVRAAAGFLYSSRGRAALQAIRRPAAGRDDFALHEDTFVATSFGGAVAVYDLGDLRPPIGQEPPARAVEVILAGPFADMKEGELLELSGLGSALVERLRRSGDPVADSALTYLARWPVPAALPLLLERLAKVQDPEETTKLIQALSVQDGIEASQALIAVMRRPHAAEAARRTFDRPPSHYAHTQLWRTGRTESLGLCPAGSRTFPAGAATERAIGTAHPVVFQEVAPDGRWTVVCQAREDTDGDGKVELHLGLHGDLHGDDVRAHLVIGGGPGLAVDEVLGSDPTGRHVAARNGPCLELIDTVARTVTTLPGADLREADRAFGPTRAVTFDGDGQRMQYLRGGTPRAQVVVRDLKDGQEVTLDPGPGDLYRATLDPEGRWVLLEFVDGPWPRMITSLAARSCRGAPTSFSTQGKEGGTLRRALVATTAGAAPRELPGLLRGFGDDWLVRAADGAINIVSPQARPVQTLVPAGCRGKLLHADARRGLALVACDTRQPDRASIELHGGQAPVMVSRGPFPEEDSWYPGRRRYLAWGQSFLDLDRRAFVASPHLGPGEVRMTELWAERDRGIYAVRGDGAQLRGPAGARARRAVPRGPLRWEIGKPKR